MLGTGGYAKHQAHSVPTEAMLATSCRRSNRAADALRPAHPVPLKCHIRALSSSGSGARDSRITESPTEPRVCERVWCVVAVAGSYGRDARSHRSASAMSIARYVTREEGCCV